MSGKDIENPDNQNKKKYGIYNRLAWLADDQRLSVVGMTDHGDVAAYPVR